MGGSGLFEPAFLPRFSLIMQLVRNSQRRRRPCRLAARSLRGIGNRRTLAVLLDTSTKRNLSPPKLVVCQEATGTAWIAMGPAGREPGRICRGSVEKLLSRNRRGSILMKNGGVGVHERFPRAIGMALDPGGRPFVRGNSLPVAVRNRGSAVQYEGGICARSWADIPARLTPPTITVAR